MAEIIIYNNNLDLFYSYIITPCHFICATKLSTATTSPLGHSSFERRRGIPPLLIEEGQGVVIY